MKKNNNNTRGAIRVIMSGNERNHVTRGTWKDVSADRVVPIWWYTVAMFCMRDIASVRRWLVILLLHIITYSGRCQTEVNDIHAVIVIIINAIRAFREEQCSN